MRECVNKALRDLEQKPAPQVRRRGALALVGAWCEAQDEHLDALIVDIYSRRQQDFGRPVGVDT